MITTTDAAIAALIITPELFARQGHSPDHRAEEAAVRRISDAMAVNPSSVFEVCAETALTLCNADSCGISRRETTDNGEEVFRWIALAGVLRHHLYGTTPRWFSPCGVCVDSGAPLLMRQPELVYKYLDVGPTFHDVLLIPILEMSSH